MTEHAVVIAGGGPTGLMLAGELALAGVDVAIVERRTSQDLAGSRAGGLHSRTIEVLDQRGIADRFLSRGQVVQAASFSGIPLDISDFPTRRNYGLGLWQNRFEEILAGWVGELAAPSPAGVAQPRRARRLRHHPMGGPGSADRRQIRWHVGASGTWRGHRSHCRADPARLICRLGGRPNPSEAP
jgi:2-polyprenyl-6-methoxyphenol hydroxylase-like FAD-dependent oxidoreductase